MMRLTALTPMLRTQDIKGTMEFYTKVLGFEVKNYDSGWGWAAIFRDNVALMLSLPNEHIEFNEPHFTGSFYFETDNVNELWEKLKDKAKVCYPIEDFEYGMREFAIFDNNNYILQFGQDTESIK